MIRPEENVRISTVQDGTPDEQLFIKHTGIYENMSKMQPNVNVIK